MNTDTIHHEPLQSLTLLQKRGYGLPPVPHLERQPKKKNGLRLSGTDKRYEYALPSSPRKKDFQAKDRSPAKSAE
jgi:hypothetical protein